MQGDNIQTRHTPFPIWNQFTVPCPVLTVATWPAYHSVCILLQNLFISLLLPTFSPFLSISLALVKNMLNRQHRLCEATESFNFGATLIYEKTVTQILFTIGQKNSGYSFSNRTLTQIYLLTVVLSNYHLSSVTKIIRHVYTAQFRQSFSV